MFLSHLILVSNFFSQNIFFLHSSNIYSYIPAWLLSFHTSEIDFSISFSCRYHSTWSRGQTRPVAWKGDAGRGRQKASSCWDCREYTHTRIAQWPPQTGRPFADSRSSLQMQGDVDHGRLASTLHLHWFWAPSLANKDASDSSRLTHNYSPQ